RGAEEMAVRRVARGQLDPGRPRLRERLPRAFDVPLEQTMRVVGDAVDELGRGHPERVDELARDLDVVLLVGEVFADDPPLCAAPEALAHVAVVLLAPGAAA